MSWPLSQDYNEAIQAPAANFSDPDLKRGQVVCNALGLPMPFSGNFADVYQVKCPDGSRWAVKCFTREAPGLRERYQEISKHLRQAKLPFTVDFSYLEQGIRIAGKWYPVLKMQWVEGQTLNQFVSQNLDKPAMLEGLLQVWGRMAKQMRSANVGHCDLQHGNVLLVPGANANSLALKLIDYDGMWVPALAHRKSGEVGHPCYQHPLRLREQIYNIDVDRFPVLLVAIALRALKAKGKALWDRFDNGDNLLFQETDLLAPLQSQLFLEMTKTGDTLVRQLMDILVKALRGRLETVPLLEEVMPQARPAPTPAKVTSPTATPIRLPAQVAAPVASAQSPWYLDKSAPLLPVLTATQSRGVRGRIKGVPVWAWAVAIALLVVSLGVAGGVAALAMSGNPNPPQARNNPPPKDKDVTQVSPFMPNPPDPPADRDKTSSAAPKDKDGPAEHPADPTPPSAPPSANSAWLTAVAAMKADEQVEAVKAELKKRNPEFDGQVTPTIENGMVTELVFSTDEVTDISPVRALVGLRTLHCSGSGPSPGRLADLSPLKDLKLTTLDCACTPVSDLSPLANMKLAFLNVSYTRVSDLTQLQGMPITNLACAGTQVSDLSPLKDMKLTGLSCDSTKVSDLSLLKDMKLQALRCDFHPWRDTELLRSITTLEWIQNKPAADFWKEVDDQRAKFDAWCNQVAAMKKWDDQVNAVADELKKRNPGFDGKVTHAVGNGMVTELVFSTDEVTDISPVRALVGLRTLHCSGSGPSPGRLADLSPLKDLKLTTLWCGNTAVSDLSPLKDLKLTTLACNYTQVSDLSPLKDMKLAELNCEWTKVSDLSPLKDLKLTLLYCNYTQVSDLSPLKDMKLSQLFCCFTRVSDLSPLKDMKLTVLWFAGTRVSDLSPLKGMPLGQLMCSESVSDLSLLKGMPLTGLWCGGRQVSDLSPLKDMKLRFLNCSGTQVSDLSPLKGMPLENLWCDGTRVSDLSLLKDMKLTFLNCSGTQVSDLSPLKGMPLGNLWCNGTRVSDLSPLKDMKLTNLRCNGTKVSDLSPLKDMPLKELWCEFKPERDSEILRSIKSLETINDKPAKDFWKDVGDAPKNPPPMPAEKEVTNFIGMKLVLIPAGKFMMGSPKDEQGRQDNEGPQHEVEITKAYYMGAHPVTKGQFATFVQDDHYKTEAELSNDKETWQKPGFDQTDDDPVVEVSWNDAVKFCEWLSKKEKKTYKLPTEAEWEYACRAGTETAYSFGDNPAALGDYAWFNGNSDGHTNPVGGKKPNPWDLYDMHGNVGEWCDDWYGDYKSGYIKDPVNVKRGDGRVLRGGSVGFDAGHCRAACRNGLAPAVRQYNFGFRVVLRAAVQIP